MKLLRIILPLVGLCMVRAAAAKNIVCYYDSRSYLREGLAKLMPSDLALALEFCTHLVYGYAGLKPSSLEVYSLHPDLDMFNYSQVTALKAQFPNLKIYLSVGGDGDVGADQAYVELLEASRERQQMFIDSAVAVLRTNGFDGLDLAPQLPRNKPRKVHSPLGTYWKKFKKLFTGDFIVDKQAAEHKDQFTSLAGHLKEAFRVSNLSLALTVLPNVNSTWYFDAPKLEPFFDFVNLAAFDFLTPFRNPCEADFTAPIFMPPDQNRLPHYNIEFQVNHWLQNQWPAHKLHLGVPSFGRTWKMTTDSGLTGMPVVGGTDGAADPGLQSRTPGLLSWPEICAKLPNSVNANYRGPDAPLRRVTDLEHKYGNYALRPADAEGANGLWVSYDDPDIAGIKASWARERGLGGVALFDLSLDDFRGLCTGQRYPVLRSLKYNL